ncbi:MAG: bifunctional phosphopantothenoylcysteine decarboxylase/phosphopantothenate--cysteine ligase CoaBC [Pyrinomonadaceae bacterium]
MSDSQHGNIKKRVALGITGGIAAYKAAEVLRGLQRSNCDVRVAMTKRACEFITPLTFRALSGTHVVVDDYAPDNPDPIAHITFSQTVDLFLVAPATANVLAKFANGIADDFISSTYLACTAPILLAPAMNPTMWAQPSTQRNIKQLRADGVTILDPDEGEMACGTFGPGRLSEPDLIVKAALDLMSNRKPSLDLTGERLLITVGATREDIDPVRFISNRSSGRMGFALAEAARRRGADVTVVAGLTTVEPPGGVRIIRAVTADEMSRVVTGEIANASVFVGAAAVADYKPVTRAEQKIKKSNGELTIQVERTPDILSQAASRRSEGTLIVGFAAETESVIANAQAKLQAKKIDAIVANDVTRTDSGFDSTTNSVTIIRKNQSDPVQLPAMSKFDVANRILDEIVNMRAGR